MESASLLATDYLGKPLWAWLLFGGLVIVLLAFDLGILHRKAREIRAAESLLLSAGYVAVTLIFGVWVWASMGAESGTAYLTGFFIEKTLALDNVFVISLIFTTLAIPPQFQHRVLFYGILGVVVMRAIVIALGTALISKFAWLLLVFGVILVVTGLKMLIIADNPAKWVDNPVLRFIQNRMRVTKVLHGEAFLVRMPNPRDGRHVIYATPLLVALILVEFVDLVFAVDSLPAIFAISTDPYIVYTSNIFAILGLRALYFALVASVSRFRYLKYALSIVLIFIGLKIFWNQLFGKIDPLISLGVTLSLLLGGVIVSMWKAGRQEEATEPGGAEQPVQRFPLVQPKPPASTMDASASH